MTALDASALVSLFVGDANSRAVRAWLRRDRRDLAVSTFGLVEFASVVGRCVRSAQFSAEHAQRVLAHFDAWIAERATVLDVEPADHRAAAAFVRRLELGLRAPDALHIAVCRRARLPLLTFDRHQAAAATALGVACDPAGATGPA